MIFKNSYYWKFQTISNHYILIRILIDYLLNWSDKSFGEDCYICGEIDHCNPKFKPINFKFWNQLIHIDCFQSVSIAM